MFPGSTVRPDSIENKLGSRNQEASLSADKNIWIVLVSCYSWKCIPTAISGGVDISEVRECHLLWHMSSQWGSKRLLQGLVSHHFTAYLSIFNPFWNQWITVILSKEWNPHNFEPHNSLNLSFTNIRGLFSFLLNINLSLNQTSLTFLLYVRQTWMTQLILAIYL